MFSLFISHHKSTGRRAKGAPGEVLRENPSAQVGLWPRAHHHYWTQGRYRASYPRNTAHLRRTVQDGHGAFVHSQTVSPVDTWHQQRGLQWDWRSYWRQNQHTANSSGQGRGCHIGRSRKSRPSRARDQEDLCGKEQVEYYQARHTDHQVAAQVDHRSVLCHLIHDKKAQLIQVKKKNSWLK